MCSTRTNKAIRRIIEFRMGIVIDLEADCLCNKDVIAKHHRYMTNVVSQGRAGAHHGCFQSKEVILLSRRAMLNWYRTCDTEGSCSQVS